MASRVVASEVKKLAEESNKATRSIFGVVETIQQEVVRLTETVDESSREQVAQLQAFDLTKQAFIEFMTGQMMSLHS